MADDLLARYNREPGCGHPGKILVGMSGGVDSSVASMMLSIQGWEVIGFYLLTCDEGTGELSETRSICSQLGIPFRFMDIRSVFRKKIIQEFIGSYMAGKTPNPCVICNAEIKFAVLLEEADRLGCQAIATGHYVRVVHLQKTGRYALGRSSKNWKDQSYFLYRLSQQQLSRLVFPLSGLEKSDVRRLAAESGLLGESGGKIAEKPDSQDLCFIKDLDYAGYIQKTLENNPENPDFNITRPGPVVNKSGQHIGTHQGLIHYTIGQRKGFSVQTTERLFVLEKHLDNNSLVVGPYEDIFRESIEVIDTVYSGLSEIGEGQKLEARIRNAAREVPCKVYPESHDHLHVLFDNPVAAPAPGQSCVFYRDGLIMAGGIIA